MRPYYLIAGVILISSVASAASIKQRKEIRENEQEFAANLKKTNEKCGSQIKATFDLKTEPANVFQRPAGFGYQFCSSVLKGISDSCEDADAKAVIAEKIKNVNCVYSAGSSKKMTSQYNKYGPELELKGSTLNALFDTETGNIDYEVMQWVKTKL